MPSQPPGVALVRDPDRLGRRAVWIAFAVTMLVAAAFQAAKAADSRGAFIRWRHQIFEFWQGENIWDRYQYPNPPLLPIVLTPLMALPPVAGALAWFALKAGMAAASIRLCMRMTRDPVRPWPSWVQLAVILLSLRPILSDLHHANNNLLILFLIVSSLYAWTRGLDVLAGLAMGLAITFKLTPALFVPYFLYKRSWRAAGATMLAVGIFLLIAPSLVLGPGFNGQCLAMWWHRILSPYFEKGIVSPQEVNQSMVGVLTRLLTVSRLADEHGNSGVQIRLNLVSWDPRYVAWLVKGLSLGLVGLLALFCRARADRRRDPRLLGEFALVVLTMLFVSERSWKHHFVTILLPITYLVYRASIAPGTRRLRMTIAGSLALSALLMATTSDLGGVFTRRVDPSMVPLVSADGHAVDAAMRQTLPRKIAGDKIAQFYGLFFWSAVVLYVATAWRVSAEGRGQSRAGGAIPAPHLPADPDRATMPAEDTPASA